MVYEKSYKDLGEKFLCWGKNLKTVFFFCYKIVMVVGKIWNIIYNTIIGHKAWPGEYSFIWVFKARKWGLIIKINGQNE